MISKKTILNYSISILLVLFSFVANSQTNIYERTTYVRPGIDVSRFILPYMFGYNYTGLEFSLDTEVNYKFFPIVEVGTSKVSDYRDDYNYKMDGYYGRIGMNYTINRYRHRLDRNQFFIGFRYGYARFNDEFSDLIITNEWGATSAYILPNSMSTHWGEALIGVNAEIVKNLFMGFSVRTRFSFAKIGFSDFDPYIIPGFGKGHKTFNVGVNYTISYAIPIKQTKINQ